MNIGTTNHNLLFRSSLTAQNKSAKSSLSNVNSKLAFKANFNPMTEGEKIAEDLHTLMDIFKETANNPLKEEEMLIFLTEAIFNGEIQDCPETECFPAHEVKRIVKKIRKDPDYGEKLLNETIKILRESPNEDIKRIAVPIAKECANIIKHPDYSSLTKLQEDIKQIQKIQTNRIRTNMYISMPYGAVVYGLMSLASPDDIKTSALLCVIALTTLASQWNSPSVISAKNNFDSAISDNKNRKAHDIMKKIAKDCQPKKQPDKQADLKSLKQIEHKVLKQIEHKV